MLDPNQGRSRRDATHYAVGVRCVRVDVAWSDQSQHPRVRHPSVCTRCRDSIATEVFIIKSAKMALISETDNNE